MILAEESERRQRHNRLEAGLSEPGEITGDIEEREGSVFQGTRERAHAKGCQYPRQR
jgi:hypothetical protein